MAGADYKREQYNASPDEGVPLCDLYRDAFWPFLETGRPEDPFLPGTEKWPIWEHGFDVVTDEHIRDAPGGHQAFDVWRNTYQVDDSWSDEDIYSEVEFPPADDLTDPRFVVRSWDEVAEARKQLAAARVEGFEGYAGDPHRGTLDFSILARMPFDSMWVKIGSELDVDEALRAPGLSLALGRNRERPALLIQDRPSPIRSPDALEGRFRNRAINGVSVHLSRGTDTDGDACIRADIAVSQHDRDAEVYFSLRGGANLPYFAYTLGADRSFINDVASVRQIMCAVAGVVELIVSPAVRAMPRNSQRNNKAPVERGTKLGRDERNEFVLELPREIHPKSAWKGGAHASPRFHQRRGHWRRTPSGKTIWVSPASVGNPANGVVSKEYQIVAGGGA
jgi:hypothetical protein